ncbi:hypothetical protein AALP_AA3G107600 [Arabis alpina]|uniref:Peptidase A1 domain-containing protein n=1 Tax=Arabis alpina TaxID=50452 RepID=A0A087H8E2_ARAAL|nr:hypothetical protein AALP_AA3G107600 [Arabis alpina]
MKILFLFLVVFLYLCVTPTFTKPSHPFVLKLVRRDTLLAEKYPKLHGTRETNTAISHLSPNRDPPVFLAKVSVGEPPVPQLLYVDTGSSFTWIRCGACNLCEPQLSSYDPVASSTYKIVSCDDGSYETSPALSPVTKTGECHYSQLYFDGSESRGTLAKETIQFETDDAGIYYVSNVEFGCARNITNGFNIGTGLLGLGYEKISILKHFENKFSICFDALSSDDPNSGHSFLALGDGARTTGQSTPLFMRYGHYHLDLEIISVNGRDIPNHLTPIKGNTIIDTGTTILTLAGESYTEVKNHIDKLLEGHDLHSFSDGPLVCYNGTIQHKLSLLPTVSLTFYKGASLELDPTSLFHQFEEDYFCLAVMMSPETHLNIIGTTALQNYNIGFDLEDEKVYMDKISCDYIY